MKKKKEMKNKGLSQHRFKRNPLEKRFAEEWEKINTAPFETLGYLKTSNGKYLAPSDREREKAATIIQWLGSPVGQNFIKDVMGGVRKNRIDK